jgi:glycosyltransferase involved in cell wall biosynthesis
MNSPDPVLSVLMPVRDGAAFIQQSIESVQNQTLSDFELLIVDDGSQDPTVRIVEQLAGDDARILLIRQAADGMRAALNRGLERARCPLVARMDADDIALPDRFALQVRFMNEHPEVVALGGQTIAMDPEGCELYPIRHLTDAAQIEACLLSGRNCMSHPTMMFRRHSVLEVGGYQDEYPTDDYGLWIRLLDQGQLANLDEYLLKYRVHAAVSTILKHRSQQEAGIRIVSEVRKRRGLPPLANPATDHAPQSVGRIHHHWAMSAASAGHFQAARKHAIQAIKLEPTNLHAFWTLLKGCLRIRGFRSTAIL